MGRNITTPPIQFTKAELRVIEDGAKLMGVEWRNGYRSTTRMLAVASILRKINEALCPVTPTEPTNE